ncbi:fatty acid desaturase family protein [Phycicoccus flavus]|uniref:fatty acid desaturase family protein n=1 Tax=Phycicoccus flavus TaxID=2502783 RepID=UPI000FEC123C|nr:acyl-CoA desaturase [Phycicoccus flavus]NHA67670.1 acyl-CoA desaturase [Phycicoccus flavus]
MPSTPDDLTPRSPAGPRPGSDYAVLLRDVRDLGLLRRRHGWYWTRLVGSVLVLAGWVGGCVVIGDTWWQLGWAAVLGVVLTQVAFLGHDAAHRQIFASAGWNDWVSLVVADLLVGVGYGWWRGKHTRHHAHPNRAGHDPDVSAGVLSYTVEDARRSRVPVLRFLAAHQGWLFFPLILLEGVSLHADGIRRVLSRERLARRGVEAVLLGARLGSLPALLLVVLPPGKAAAALGVQLAVFGFLMGAAFAPNHIGMPVVRAGTTVDFAARQVLVSRNISGGPMVSVAMGGLDHQIEHHLFPSMPRPNLVRARPVVRAFCAERNLPYTETGLLPAYGQVVRHLNAVGSGRVDPFLCPLVAQRRAL